MACNHRQEEDDSARKLDSKGLESARAQMAPRSTAYMPNDSAPSCITARSVPNCKRGRISEGEEGREQKRMKSSPNLIPSRSLAPPERPSSLQMDFSSPFDQVGDECSMAKPYEYQSLGPQQIRLLRLHPGANSDEIYCSLVLDNIDMPGAYSALSYCWGSCETAMFITLSDEYDDGRIATFTVPRRKAVGANLLGALRALRMSNRPLVLWVDALCINQDDCEEKSSQIMIMSKIYQKAHDVKFWLGEEDATSTWTMSNLHRAFRPGFFTQDCSSASPVLPSALISGVTNLLSRPWFSRSWIIQELAFASNSSFVCGRQEVDSEEFTTLVELMVQQSGSTSSTKMCSSIAMNNAHTLLSLGGQMLCKSVDGRIIKRTKTLTELVLGSASCLSTDPRDKVYSLLSLAKETGSAALIPDYTKSNLEVFADFVTYSIRETGSLDIILQPWVPLCRPRGVRSPLTSKDDGQIPSWLALLQDAALDTSQDSRRNNGDCLVNVSSPYSAANGTTPTAYIGPFMRKRRSTSVHHESSSGIGSEEKVSNKVLHVEGFQLGVVTDISTKMADGLISRDALELAGISLSGGCGALQTCHGAIIQSIARTLVAGKDKDGTAAPTRFCLALKQIFTRVLQECSLDTVDLLETKTDINIIAFLERVRDIIWNRRLFRSMINEVQENLLGIGPKGMRRGDRIVILYGCSVPVILRSVGEGYVELIGASYIDGKMDAETFSQLDNSKIEELTETFCIL